VQDDDNLSSEKLNNNPILKELGIEFSSDDGVFNQELIYNKPFVSGKEEAAIRIPIFQRSFKKVITKVQ
jgi:hypothetical protein